MSLIHSSTHPLIKPSFIAGLFLVSLLSACGGGGGGDTPPSATSTTPTPTPTTPVTRPALTVTAVTLSNATPTVGATLQFTGGVCGGGTGMLTTSWNFGDGSATSDNGTHTYTSTGWHSVTVTCGDSTGTTPVVSIPLSINISTAAPVTTPPVTITPVLLSGLATAGTPVQFTGGVCGGGTGSLSVSWNFGDGSSTSSPSSPNTHTYASPGYYQLRVTCNDSTGSHATSTMYIGL